MNFVLTNHLVLAQTSAFKGLSDGFKPDENPYGAGSVLLVLAVILGFLVILGLLARFADRRRRRAPSNSPLRLFISLCRAHGLAWSEGWLLWRAARWHRLKHPSRFFLEPERLDPANLSPALRSKTHQLQALRERLFAGLSGHEAEAAAIPDAQAAGLPRQGESDGAKLVSFPLLETHPSLPDAGITDPSDVMSRP